MLARFSRFATIETLDAASRFGTVTAEATGPG